MNKILMSTLLWCFLTTSTWSMTTKVIKDTNKEKNYSLNIAYPYLNENNAFNRVVKARLAEIKNDFEIQVSKNINSSMALPGENILKVSYKIKYQKGQLVSLLFEQFTFYKGAAHPNTTFFSMNFYGNKLITLNSLFKNESNYLNKIASFCIYELSKKNISDRNWISEGAAAKLKNYAVWNIHDNGLDITFNPYQVAAYVYGKQSVIVPLSVFESELKKSSHKLWDK